MTMIEFSVIGNTLILRLNMQAPGDVIAFHGIFGVGTLRSGQYYWRIRQTADPAQPAPENQLRTDIGDLSLGMSDAVNALNYIALGGEPMTIQNGQPFQISQGVLRNICAIVGIYQLEFSSMWGPGTRKIIGPWRGNPVAEIPRVAELPDEVRPLFVRFYTALTGNEVLLEGTLDGLLEFDDAMRLVDFLNMVMVHW